MNYDKLIERANLLKVDNVLCTKTFISATVVSSNDSTYYTPIIYLKDLDCSCGCMSCVRDNICKHIIAVLLNVGRKDLIEEMIKNEI